MVGIGLGLHPAQAIVGVRDRLTADGRTQQLAAGTVLERIRTALREETICIELVKDGAALDQPVLGVVARDLHGATAELPARPVAIEVVGIALTDNGVARDLK